MVTLIYGTFDLQDLGSLTDQRFYGFTLILVSGLLTLNMLRPKSPNEPLINQVTNQLTLNQDTYSYLLSIYWGPGSPELRVS